MWGFRLRCTQRRSEIQGQQSPTGGHQGYHQLGGPKSGLSAHFFGHRHSILGNVHPDDSEVILSRPRPTLRKLADDDEYWSGKKAAYGLRAAPKAWDEARDATFIHAIPELREDHKFGNLTLIPLNITARLCALFRCQIQPWRGGSGDARRRPPSSTLQGDSLACIQQLLDPGYL